MLCWVLWWEMSPAPPAPEWAVDLFGRRIASRVGDAGFGLAFSLSNSSYLCLLSIWESLFDLNWAMGIMFVRSSSTGESGPIS